MAPVVTFHIRKNRRISSPLPLQLHTPIGLHPPFIKSWNSSVMDYRVEFGNHSISIINNHKKMIELTFLWLCISIPCYLHVVMQYITLGLKILLFRMKNLHQIFRIAVLLCPWPAAQDGTISQRRKTGSTVALVKRTAGGTSDKRIRFEPPRKGRLI